jgi:hypothetical protein
MGASRPPRRVNPEKALRRLNRGILRLTQPPITTSLAIYPKGDSYLHANQQHIRAAIHQRSNSVMPKQKSTGKRTTIKPKGDARYIRRDSKGRIKESDDVGRSLKKDREQKAKTTVRPGYGDRGDQKRS